MDYSNNGRRISRFDRSISYFLCAATKEFKNKFLNLATITLPEGQAQNIMDTIYRLDELKTVTELTDLLVKK